MAAATLVGYGGRERAMSYGLHNKVLHRWSLTITGTGDTFDTKLGSKVGICEMAFSGTRASSPLGVSGADWDVPSAPISVSNITTEGVITFTSPSGACAFDLLIWTNG